MELSRLSGSPPDPSTGPIPLRSRRGAEPVRPHSPREDSIEVSALGRDLARAEAATGDAGELRFDLVSRLRAEVRAGTYRIDAQALARAMVERGEQE